ncbi:MAG: hypothetical protein WC917_05045 [Bacilli bacterium]|jgi:hypothetical protein
MDNKISEQINDILEEEVIKKEEDPQINNSDLKKLIERNIDLNQEILDSVTYVKKYIQLQKVFSLLKIIIIVIPVIFAILYLTPIFKDISVQFDGFDNFLRQIYSIN